MNMAAPIQAPDIAKLASVETEAGLIGGLLMANDHIDRVADKLKPEHFYEPLHGRIFSAICRERSLGRAVTSVTIKQYFVDDEAFQSLGGIAYLATLTVSGSNIIGIPSFAEQILDLARMRLLVGRLMAVVDKASDYEAEANDLAAEAEAAIAEVMDEGADTTELSAGDCIGKALEAIGRHDPGVTCGIDAFDTAQGPIRRKNLAILAGRPGMGKAQPLDAQVLLRDGRWVEMGALAIGTELASIDGQESVVTGVYPQGAKPIFRVTLSDGRSAECCDDHLWRVMYRDWDSPRVLPTSKLREMLARARYRNRLHVDRIAGSFGGSADLPLDPWLLGFLIGDGNLCSGQVRFSTVDREIVEAVQARLPTDLRAVHVGSGCDYRITGGPRGGAVPNFVKDRLTKLGLFGSRAHDKFIPGAYFHGDRGQRLALLQGLMDSDGWAEKWGSIRFSTASERLALDVCKLVRSLGGVCQYRARKPTYTYRGERKEGRTSYICTLRMANPEEAFTLARKTERCGRTKNTVQLNITSIEKVRTAEAQCISVSHPSRLYVTNDYTVTHNTAAALSYARGVAEKGHGVLFVSLEMSAEELGERMVADAAYDEHTGRGVPYDTIVNARIDAENMRRLVQTQEMLSDLPLEVIDIPSLKIGGLATTVRRWKRRFAARGKSLDLVVVDYLQLLGPDYRVSGPYEAITLISKGLKAIAKSNDLGVMALAQLSRKVEDRADKRPQLADLRDSGQIEQDADIVTFLLRREYYLRKEEPKQDHPDWHGWRDELSAAENRIEFICAKRRKGSERTTEGRFYGAFQAVR